MIKTVLPKGPPLSGAALASGLVLVALLVPLNPPAASSARNDLRVVSNGRYYFEAVLEVPAPVLLPDSLGGEGTVRVELPGWGSSSPEGAPVLPELSLAVAAPEGEDVRISVRGETPRVLEGIRLAPSPRRGRGGADPRESPRSIYGRDAFWPESIFETGEACYLRDLRLVPLEVRPARYNPVSGELQVYEKLRIVIEADPGASGAARPPVGSDAGGWEDVYRAAALNYPSDTADRAMRRRPASRDRLSGDYFDDSEVWLAVDVETRGMYRIAYEDLLAAGVSEAELAGLRTSTIRLYNGGGLSLREDVSVLDRPSWMTECALLIDDGDDGGFDRGDGIVFYGLGPEEWMDYYTGAEAWGERVQNVHSAGNVYWLTWEGSFESGPRARVAAIDGAPAGAALEPEMYRDRVHVERDREYNSEQQPRERGVRWELWWWQSLSASDPGGRVYRVGLKDSVVTEAPCRLKARFWGSTYSLHGYYPDHILSLSFNGSDSFLATGFFRERIDVDTTAVWAVEGENTLVARVPPVEDPYIDDRVDVSYFAWFELEYYRRFVAEGGELCFDWTEGTAGPVRFEATGFGDGTPLIFDVTDSFEPALIVNPSVSSDTVTFQVNLDGSRSNYYLVSQGALRAPAGIRRREPESLRASTAPTDYIIVTGGELAEAAETLAEWRRSHLHGVTDGGGRAYVEVVDVEELYDEFSWGLVDPLAIRDFLELRFRSAAQGERPPSYALMFGDATWDFLDLKGLGVSNIVPSYDLAYDIRSTRRFSTDDVFVLFEGPVDYFDPRSGGDRYMDMAIGRLTPVTAAEAMDLVTSKIIGFESGAEPGPWRCNVILAADDNCIGTAPEGLGEKHTDQADSLYKKQLPRALDATKIYLIDYGGPGCVNASKPEARSDFIGALRAGATLTNYVGHGSEGSLAEETLFLADDVAALDNEGRLGFFVTASCAVGKFDEPLDVGIAEGMVKHPLYGSLAAYSATTVAYVPPNKELNADLVESLFPRRGSEGEVNVGPVKTLGLSVTEAEAAFDNWFYVAPYKYVLLGDPASVLAVPGTAYPSEGPFLHLELDLDGTELAGGERDTLTGRVMEGVGAASWFNGTVDVLVQGAVIEIPLREFEPYIRTGPTFYRARADVVEGAFEISWVNPYELISGGGGRVRAYAWNEGRDALGSVADLAVTPPTAGKPDDEGPEIELSFDGDPGMVTPGSSLTIKVSDPSGINLAPVLAENALFLRLHNDDLGRVVDGPVDLSSEFKYQRGSSSSGTAVYTLPSGLPVDERTNSYRVVVRASDNFSNPSAAELAFEIRETAELTLSDVINYPNPFSESTIIGFRVRKEADIVVKIYTVSGRHVRTLRAPGATGWSQVVWDGTDSSGDPVANGVYLYKVAAAAVASPSEKADFVGRAVVLR